MAKAILATAKLPRSVVELRSVKDTVSHDTVEVLETLLELARGGDITGIAYGCTLRKNRYFTNVAGYCYQNPTFTRGMMGTLTDELASMIHSRDVGDAR